MDEYLGGMLLLLSTTEACAPSSMSGNDAAEGFDRVERLT